MLLPSPGQLLSLMQVPDSRQDHQSTATQWSCLQTSLAHGPQLSYKLTMAVDVQRWTQG